MSHVALPAEKVRQAMRAAALAMDAEGDELAKPFLKTKKWSWREFRYVDASRGHYTALHMACETWEGRGWLAKKRQLVDATTALLPLCKVANTIEVSAEHFLPISKFYG